MYIYGDKDGYNHNRHNSNSDKIPPKRHQKQTNHCNEMDHDNPSFVSDRVVKVTVN